ncbi:hypothetical protein [Erythrobacter aureus]|uniref:hypothetical protein n=1 Tax=Erythrobacter aureus TaxID=2182384 RepID=UPI003A8D7437
MPDMTEPGSALLHPDDCCLAFIDFSGPSGRPKEVIKAYRAILQLAAKLSVPVLSAHRGGDSVGSEGSVPIDDLLENAVSGDGAFVRELINPWTDNQFRQKVFEYDRARLVLAGGCSEGSLTQAALSALADLYDVYIIFDLSDEKLNREASPMAHRLIQSGVVPITARQLWLEWSEADSSG